MVPAQFDPTPLANGEVDGWVSYVTNEPITLAAKGFANDHFLFADFGLPLVAETMTVSQHTIDNERDKLKAFLTAQIKGWKDAVASPAESARLAVEVYGKDLKLDLAEQTAEATAQNDLVVSAIDQDRRTADDVGRADRAEHRRPSYREDRYQGRPAVRPVGYS